MAGPIEQKKLPPLSERLERLGLLSDWDFVFHLPLRYEDETAITPIGELVPDTGVPSQCQGTVLRAGFRATSRGQIYVAEIADDTATLGLSFFTYYRNITSTIRHGEVVRVFGQVRRGYFDETRLEMVHPKVRKPLFDAANLPKTLTPVYPTGEGIQQTWLRKRIHRALLDLNVRDLVPADLTESLGLPRLNAALGYLHNPPADAPVASLQDRTAPAWQRLKFDELLAQQITLAESRRRRRDLQAPHLDKPGENLVDAFLASLPFALTNAQKRVWREIEEDLGKDAPMHRLVQGDVGSGKTVVAALSLLRALECGHQAVLMAPTELLAEQHAKKLREWFEPLGISVFELTGRLKASEKRTVLEALKSGAARVAVGTHALIQEGVAFDKLGLCVIDEQHRFGVEQRLKLKSRGAQGTEPHLLLMSATPIPRTLAMSYLADLSVSVIDELPPGCTPDAAMRAFIAGETDILVSTTVIEVGVDVPNASVMVIEHAERFGLAQLHQLRGRVGRGSAKSFCLLLFDPNLSEEGRRRLSVIRATNDGFEVARHDLQLRGPGEFLGERQSGVPMLRFADLEHDEALLVNAVRWAPVWLEKDREAALEHARRWFKTKADYLGI